MNKERLIRNLEAELQKIERQDRVYGVGETRYDLMIKDVLNYIENSIPKLTIEEKLKEIELPNIIVGGRKNSKTLEYGKKLGRINAYQELLEGK